MARPPALTEDERWAMLALIAETAREVWGCRPSPGAGLIRCHDRDEAIIAIIAIIAIVAGAALFLAGPIPTRSPGSPGAG